MHPKNLSILDYSYNLPDNKIAIYPLEKRDLSKLLIYKNHKINQDIYKNIAQYLPNKSLLFLNDTKVLQARIIFTKQTGGLIEIFCLEPFENKSDYTTAMSLQHTVQWKCMIGGIAKWKSGELKKNITVNNHQITLTATLIKKLADAYIVKFYWTPSNLSFAEILLHFGKIPLPPYIKRNVEKFDKERYQTIFAANEGSVAAPTAGLHFTSDVFNDLKSKNIIPNFITLHVGAGTFKPVKATIMELHEMHSEWINISLETINNLLLNINHTIVAVGTTSLRSLESLYWIGVKIILNPSINNLHINQWDAYDNLNLIKNISSKDALQAIINYLNKYKLSQLFAKTQILIAPSYKFKIVNAIITNFHQPASTLLLLVAAAIGKDWKNIYEYALENDFRFLSYGDGCLLFL